MHKQRHLHYAVISVLGFALLFMTVGFAAYAQFASGNNVSAGSQYFRRVGFDAKSYIESDDSISPSTKTISKESFDFSVQLNQGEHYYAIINIANYGSDNEILDKITMSGLPEELAGKVDFRVSLSGEDYIGTTDGISLAVLRGDINRQQMFVTVSSQVPVSLDLSVALGFDSI